MFEDDAAEKAQQERRQAGGILGAGRWPEEQTKAMVNRSRVSEATGRIVHLLETTRFGDSMDRFAALTRNEQRAALIAAHVIFDAPDF
jgi:hypothetical protein